MWKRIQDERRTVLAMPDLWRTGGNGVESENRTTAWKQRHYCSIWEVEMGFIQMNVWLAPVGRGKPKATIPLTGLKDDRILRRRIRHSLQEHDEELRNGHKAWRTMPRERMKEPAFVNFFSWWYVKTSMLAYIIQQPWQALSGTQLGVKRQSGGLLPVKNKQLLDSNGPQEDRRREGRVEGVTSGNGEMCEISVRTLLVSTTGDTAKQGLKQSRMGIRYWWVCSEELQVGLFSVPSLRLGFPTPGKYT
jgi:hypothetical protein